MKRGLVILVCVAALALLAWMFVPTLRPPPKMHGPLDLPTLGRPNVVLISLDTVRPDHLGCYGHPRPTSPNIDALAAGPGGIRFARATSQAPWTLPSHMSLFTSMLPSHNRVETIDHVLSESFATLPEILRSHGYRTAAIVNNGQMRAHWGFSRGFELWRELEVDTPAGNCESITSQAISWLEADATTRPAGTPFLLFLHYYDAHDPYDPPAPFREQFGATLTGEQARELAWKGRTPETQLNPVELDALKNGYDGEIAWMDRELGKLFAKLPPDTLVVIFSDHGEAFEEHGWTLHGATLNEEEVRVALVMAHPKLGKSAAAVETPVMLLDVAPTVLGLCGIAPPPHFEGTDLRPLIAGAAPSDPRPVLSETKAVLEGRVLKSVTLGQWKLVHDLVSARSTLHKLPDESADVSGSESQMAAALRRMTDPWAAEDDHWLLHADGTGEFDTTLSVDGDGRFLAFIPTQFDPQREQLEISEDAKTIRWTARPAGGRKSLYVQTSPANAVLRLDLKTNGVRDPSRVHVGDTRPAELPVTLKDVAGGAASTRPSTQHQALHVFRHAAPGTAAAARPGKLDEQTLRQLRSLGYIR